MSSVTLAVVMEWNRITGHTLHRGITADLSAGGIRLAVTGDEERDDDLRLYLFLSPDK